MDKPQLRKHYRTKRAMLSEEDIEELSLAISNQALKLPIWDKTYYHLFLPIFQKKEVNTEYLLHILQGRDKSVVVPKVEFSSQQLKHILLQEHTVLKLSPYGIPEPENGIEIPEDQLEVIFLPLLAYDTKGNRVGYGKGFYDQFLKQCNPHCRFVGLSFFPPETEFPSSEWDVPLHYCVTPERVFTF
ncbi:MAG: 5-formyltetrahydrofolate cyclo-ligase [Flavobacteriaceae bacterium]